MKWAWFPAFSCATALKFSVYVSGIQKMEKFTYRNGILCSFSKEFLPNSKPLLFSQPSYSFSSTSLVWHSPASNYRNRPVYFSPQGSSIFFYA